MVIQHDRLREELRKKFFAKGKHYKDVANKLGYSENTISSYMCGVNSSKNVASALAGYFKLDINDFCV